MGTACGCCPASLFAPLELELFCTPLQFLLRLCFFVLKIESLVYDTGYKYASSPYSRDDILDFLLVTLHFQDIPNL